MYKEGAYVICVYTLHVSGHAHMCVCVGLWRAGRSGHCLDAVTG